jgi:hypothetical protein
MEHDEGAGDWREIPGYRRFDPTPIALQNFVAVIEPKRDEPRAIEVPLAVIDLIPPGDRLTLGFGKWTWAAKVGLDAIGGSELRRGSTPIVWKRIV